MFPVENKHPPHPHHHTHSNALFSAFVELLVLARGRVVFAGPQVAAVPYFSRQATRVWKLSAVIPCYPGYDNNAEWLLGVIDAMKEREGEMYECFQRSSLCCEAAAGGDAIAIQGVKTEGSNEPVVVVRDDKDAQQHGSSNNTPTTHGVCQQHVCGCMHGIATVLVCCWMMAAASMRRLMVLLRYRALANLKSPAYWLSRGTNMIATAIMLSSSFWYDGVVMRGCCVCFGMFICVLPLSHTHTQRHPHTKHPHTKHPHTKHPHTRHPHTKHPLTKHMQGYWCIDIPGQEFQCALMLVYAGIRTCHSLFGTGIMVVV